ncbi:SCP2 sterol-binding domain-containing protein [Saccharolobus islandicus]|uniref:SCP2 sterol-binding domain-containing protein n=1 Tax=Saccharolobus islandicus TaxID=43080 RepID=UPI000364C6AE|nr:SCP2 sterol-binding domain-containing protein [Sulfolobus islandicus]
MKFPSLEWAEKLCNEINNIEVDEIRSWNWDILFILRNVKNNDMKFKVKIKAGKCLGVDEDGDADYVIEGDYNIWKSILLGELDLAVALLSGKLKLIKGDRLNLLRHIRAAVNIASIIRARGLTNDLEIM